MEKIKAIAAKSFLIFNIIFSILVSLGFFIFKCDTMFMASSGGGALCRVDVPILTELLLTAQAVFISLAFLSIISIGLPVAIYIALWWLSYKQIRKNFKYYVLLPLSFPPITFLIYAALNFN